MRIGKIEVSANFDRMDESLVDNPERIQFVEGSVCCALGMLPLLMQAGEADAAASHARLAVMGLRLLGLVDRETVCARCGASYEPDGTCSRRPLGCQGGRSEARP